MATSWEVYKKKRKEGEDDIAPVKKSSNSTLDVSSDEGSSWASYSASRAADKLVTTKEPFKEIVQQQAKEDKQEESSGWKKVFNTITGVGGNFLMGIESTIPKATNYLNESLEYVTQKATGKAFEYILGKTGMEQEKVNQISDIAGSVLGEKVYSTSSKIIGSDLYEVNQTLNSESMTKWRNETIQKNTEKAKQGGVVGEFMNDVALGVGGNVIPVALSFVPGGQIASFALFTTSAGGSYLEDADARGMNEDQRIGYATGMGLFEGTFDYLLNGLNINRVTKLLGKGEIFSKNALKSAGFSFIENAAQEGLTEPATELAADLAGGHGDWEGIWSRSLRSAAVGGVTGLFLDASNKGMGAATYTINVQQNKNEAIKTAEQQLGRTLTTEEIEQITKQVQEHVKAQMLDVEELSNEERAEIEKLSTMTIDDMVESALTGIVKSGKVDTDAVLGGVNEAIQSKNTAQIQGLQEAIAAKQQELAQVQDVREQQIIQEEIEVLNQELNEVTNAQQFTSEDLKQQRFTYEATENDSEFKQAVYESASKVFDNTKASHDFVDVVAKIAEDRQTKYEFVNKEMLKEIITDPNINLENVSVNGLVTEDGRVLINVDSKQGLDFILGHETTHLLEGTTEYKALQDLVVEYAKNKGIYEDRVAKLHSLYKGTNADINAELTSDLVGELLFTDQAFIENLSVKQPTLFEKIKNFISDLIVKVKGTAQEKQLRQLQRSFEKAYKAQGTQTTTNTKYSFVGEEITRGNRESQEALEVAKELEKAHTDMDYIRQNTGWFKGKDGNWKAEIDDSNSKLITKLEKNTTYKLGDILQHDALYNLQPAYRNIEVITRNMDSNGSYSREKGRISLSNQILSDPKQVRSTLLHEIQHATQHAENWKGGTSVKAAGSWEAYKNQYGEKEAKEVQARRNMSYEDRTQIAPNNQTKTRYSLSEDTDIDTKINSSMTMDQAKRMVEMAFIDNGIYNWYDGKYQNGEEWLQGEGIDEVETYLDNTVTVLDKYLNPIYEKDSSYGDEYFTSDILQAYLDKTLTGQQKQKLQRLDLSKDTGYKDNRFYAPQDIKGGQELYQIANQRVTKSNKNEVYKARADFIINAHNKGYVESLGLTQQEVNQKLKSWANYTKKAMDLSNSLNEGVAKQNKWTGIENSSIVNTISISNDDMSKLVKEIQGDSSEWQRQYITSTMLALDTHIDYSNVTFKFGEQRQLSERSALGEYQRESDTILIGNGYQNTVAHEIGHYIDSRWARDLGLKNNYLSDSSVKLDGLTTEQSQFVNNFKEFINNISENSYLGSKYSTGGRGTSYWQHNTEIFARFVGRFVEWTKNQATNNRYGYEEKHYQDNFTEQQYKEFVKILQEKSMLDTTNNQYSLTAQEEAPVGNIFGADLKYQVEEAIAPLQETIETLTEQLNTVVNSVEQLQENIAPVTEEVNPEQVIQSTKPTLEEVKNLIDIRDNKSGSEYASAFFALRDKYGQVNLYKSLNEYYATGTVTDEDITAPTSQNIVEQQGQEAFENITDNDAPIDIENRSFEDVVDDIIWDMGFEGTTETKVESPFDTRDIDEVGNRKVKAYQYENPEVRPYFQEEAQNMMWDLNNTIKGERSFNDQLYYDSNGEKGFFGTTRQTTEAIAYLKDKYSYSYAQIEKGLNDIIEDNGKENNAVAKRIEFMLDERLREGYTTSDGIPIPPNDEYIKFLVDKQITEYNKEAFNALTDADMPIENEVAPIEELVQEQTTEVQEQTIVPDVQESTTGQLELKVEESIAPTENEAQNQNTELSDTSVETQEQEKVAQILSEVPTQQNKKQRLWAKVRAAIFDKGSVFEDLSIKTKNREIMAKWDNTLLAESVAQDVMLNGTREIDAKSKTSNQLSKSLVDIKAEVENSGKVQEFSEYLYHKHNVDRMSIESNAQARMAELQETTLKRYDIEAIEKLSRKRVPNKTDKKSEQLQFKDVAKQAEVEINAAKEYMRLSEAKNKPVFGESVTAEVSQQRVNEFEMNNPEFMDWANDVYDYNKANLNHLVKNGVISQETADQFAELYPNYVPIGRAKNLGNAINVPLFTDRTGVNNPIKRATGGDSDILPLFDTMAKRTIQTYRAAAKNDFGLELKNTLNSVVDNQTTNVDEILDNVDQQENLLQEGKNGKAPTFTVFENGEKVTYEITQDMYDALKPVSDSSILSTTFKPFNKISNFHRGLLTEYNPVFMLTNSIKDAQDILLNSQHATKTYSKMPEAYAQIIKKGYWYQEYMANGGQQNSYFDSQEGNFDSEAKGLEKVLELPPLKQISQLNNVIELAPRLAEYIASRESGRSKKVSMLDAARVTTNFKAGGDVTKWANRNGATFLNASIQGAMQQVRNVREANMNGLKGYANLASKFALAGVPAMILNSLLWGDDEEYEELSDYVKQSYWIVGKTEDGNFIRIPKGRMITVVQEGLNQMANLVTGNDEADLGQFLEIVGNNIAPNNPIENNVLSPIIQAVTNKTWYGGDLVPTRLQDVPAEEQYDESIDKLSIAIGQATGISPYKINYVLDQYSGGVGDVLLPMMTQQAEDGNDSLGSKLLAPLTSKFSVDSTMKNQNVSDLYDLSDKITVKANSSKATDTDILQNKYLNAIKTEMNELYKEKREIQNSDLPDSEKYNQVRDIQDQINNMAKEAINNYENVSISSSYASVNDKEYYNKNGIWTKVNADESTDLNSLGMTTRQKEEYFNLKNSISTIDNSESENKKSEIATAVMNANLTDEQKAYVYGKSYSSDETLSMVVNGGINFNEYLKYAAQTITADKDSDGKSISGSRKDKVISAINSLNLDIPQKAMLIRKEYSSFRDYNNDIVRYVNGLDIDYQTKVDILSELEMTVSADGTVSWK